MLFEDKEKKQQILVKFNSFSSLYLSYRKGNLYRVMRHRDHICEIYFPISLRNHDWRKLPNSTPLHSTLRNFPKIKSFESSGAVVFPNSLCFHFPNSSQTDSSSPSHYGIRWTERWRRGNKQEKHTLIRLWFNNT